MLICHLTFSLVNFLLIFGSFLNGLFFLSLSFKSFVYMCIYMYIYTHIFQWLSDKESACNAGATGDTGSIPGSGRSPGERHGNPLHCSCLENALYRGAWWATVHGVAKSQTQLKQFGMHAWNTCFPESRLLDMIGYHNKIPQTDGLNNRNVFSYSSGGWKSKIEETAGYFLLKPPVLACRWLPSFRILKAFSLCLHIPVPSYC